MNQTLTFGPKKKCRWILFRVLPQSATSQKGPSAHDGTAHQPGEPLAIVGVGDGGVGGQRQSMTTCPDTPPPGGGFSIVSPENLKKID